MRIAFLGTPDFAVPSLERLAAAGFEIAAVITQPDRPKGRGGKPAAPPVKEKALELGLAVFQPEKIRTPAFLDFFRGLGVRAGAVVAYGRIIPQGVIDAAPLGLINVHASLLPKYRGAAPVQWAVAEGEARTGVTTMRIDAGLDTGDILLVSETEIGPEETAMELGRRLAEMGADLLMETLGGLAAGTITPVPQDHGRATLAPMLKKEDGRIDWSWPAARIHNRVRGFQPWPGAWTSFRGQSLHIWKSRVPGRPLPAAPGTLETGRQGLFAACGDGTALELIEVQLEGRNRLPARDFVNGQRPAARERLGEQTI